MSGFGGVDGRAMMGTVLGMVAGYGTQLGIRAIGARAMPDRASLIEAAAWLIGVTVAVAAAQLELPDAIGARGGHLLALVHDLRALERLAGIALDADADDLGRQRGRLQGLAAGGAGAEGVEGEGHVAAHWASISQNAPRVTLPPRAVRG